MDKPNYKLRMKIGTAEFEAEGREDVVKEQFSAFMAAVSSIKEEPAAKHVGEPEVTPPAAEPSTQKNAAFSRVFNMDGPVSLRAIPQTETANADALLMLIYAHTELKGESSVTGTALMKSAKQSGLSIERIDQTISKKIGFVLSAGVRKGLRYSLNNRGLAESEKLANDLVK